MATELERLVVSIEANTTQIDRKLRALQGEVDSALGGVENRTNRFNQNVGRNVTSVNRLVRSMAGGFALLSAVRFGENIIQNFDKIAERAEKLGVEVDRNLVKSMTTAREGWEKQWLQIEIFTAQVIDRIIKLAERSPIGLLGKAQNDAAAAAAKAAGGFNTSDDPQAQHFRAAGAGIPLATDSQFLEALKKRAAEEDALKKKAAQDSIALSKKLAEEQRQIDQANADGTIALREQIAKEQRDALNDAANFDLAAEIQRREDEADALKEIQDKIVDAERDANNRRLDQIERLNERIIGDFAQTASDVVLESKNIGDAFAGLMRSIAATVLENTIKDALVGTSIKGLLGFASGGRPPVGFPSVVGEQGPEIFIPDVPGRVIPHGASASGGAVFNVNVSLAGANGDAAIVAASRAAVVTAIQQVKAQFPAMLSDTQMRFG